MSNEHRDEIRRILKNFGIQADEVLTRHLAQPISAPQVRILIRLSDITDYGENPPDIPLELELEGVIQTNS